jgi:hypothetical protein
VPVSSPIEWTDVQDAIYQWCSGATGLPFIWEDQDAPQPAYPYGSMRLTSGPRRVAGADEVRVTYDGGQDLGHEIGLEVGGLREITVTVQAHVNQRDSGPDDDATNFVTRLQSSLALPSVQELLRDAGLAVVEEGPVLNLGRVLDDTWVARAAMDVRLGLASNLVERTGYVATVAIEPDVTDVDGSPVDADVQKPFEVGG